MKRIPTGLLQAVVALIGIAVLALLIWTPSAEGRAAGLDLFSIYTDPFILYGYAASIVFFVGLYKVFRLLGYIGQNNAYTPSAIGALKSIKYCGILLSVLIVAAGLYIKISHNAEDDPAGFLAMCIVTTFISIVVATAAAVVEKKWQHAIDIQSGKQTV